ncbi:amino acid ABC transporter substrate-binding protein [Carboxylicivirga sp. N1Y90]|uniref:amino acid ABC transporter substrate-binding protein n=1 Tax=Carboxylicivirga fragile TaxID=3417571 RepID=UPI003D33D2D9|nr:LysM peptidoglycan-binding domain-containing protein [Marinilabiliaceae bacterium N1Y90]
MKYSQTIFAIFISALLMLFSFEGKAQTEEVKGKEKISIKGQVYYLHRAQKAEGLFRIGVNYGVSEKEILEANPEAAFGIKEGQLLKIPVISGRNSTKQELDSTAYIYHTVEQGQTVFYLSQKYDVPKEVIHKYNPGSDQQLLLGTIIKIPKQYDVKSPIDNKDKDNGFVLHTAKPKENIYALSQKYGVSIESIIESNPVLRSGVLPNGSVIRIPIVEKEAEVADTNNEVLEDELYIYHKIEAGETLFSISQVYHCKLNTVQDANKSIDPEDLPLGFVVRIPKLSMKKGADHNSNSDLFTIHKVKRKEGLYAISRNYNIDADIIRTVNSEYDLNNLKKGMLLRIPNRHWFKMTSDQERMAKEAAAEESKSKVEISEVDCNAYRYDLNKPTLKVAVLLPFNVEASKRVNIIEEEVDGEIVVKDRDEKIISRHSKVFVEFYQGTLLAIDSMKKQGVNIELFTYDTAPDTNKVKRILAYPEMVYMDLIIGPAYTSNLRLVSDFSKQYNVPMVYPFSTKNSELASNPRLFQAMPIDTLLFDKMANQIINSAKNKRIVLVRTEDSESVYERKLSKLFTEKIYWESLKKGEVPDFVEYKFKQDDLASLEQMFAKDRANVVVIPSVEEAQVNRIITTVKGAKEKTKADITLWGMPEWLRYQTINPEDIHRLNGHLFSYYAIDYNNKETFSLIQKYRTWFKTEPMSISPYFQNASVKSNMSRYSLWGYDVSYYFLSALKSYGKQFDYCLDQHQPHAMQTALKFRRLSNWSGLVNESLYILHFTPDYQFRIKEID